MSYKTQDIVEWGRGRFFWGGEVVCQSLVWRALIRRGIYTEVLVRGAFVWTHWPVGSNKTPRENVDITRARSATTFNFIFEFTKMF